MFSKLIYCFIYFSTVAVIVKGFSTNVRLSKRILTNETIHDVSINVELIRATETNITLYEALIESGHQKKEFSVSGQEFKGLGFYIQSIGGLYENKKENKFWMIYKVDEKGVETLTPKGVTSTIVSNGEHYLFRYQVYIYDGHL